MSFFKCFSLTVAVGTLLVGFAGCGGDDAGNDPRDATASFVVNGTPVHIVANDGFGVVSAQYEATRGRTVIGGSGTGAYGFTLLIPGRAAGNWTHDDSGVMLKIGDGLGAEYLADKFEASAGALLNVSITDYGNVDGFVDGTFSGTVVTTNHSETLTITDGRFHAYRYPDWVESDY